MKKIILSTLSLFSMTIASSQTAPNIEWSKCYGGSGSDYGHVIRQTADGGFMAFGSIDSPNDQIPGFHENQDVWIAKLSPEGNIEWQRCYGGTETDGPSVMQLTPDNGCIFIASTTSDDGDVSGYHGNSWYDVWVVKLDSVGNIEWQKCLGGTESEIGRSVSLTDDGGYVLASDTYSTDGDLTGNVNLGGTDLWIVKLDASGNIVSQKCFGGTLNEFGHSAQQTPDGGYIVGASSYSSDGDLTLNQGSKDIWVLKLGSNLSIEWQKTYGGSEIETISLGNVIHQTIDGGYAFAAGTSSNDGDVTNNHGNSDLWLVKLDATGGIEWQKCFGNTDYDSGVGLHQTNDQTYFVYGSNSGDFWLLKISESGDLIWDKSVGGTYADELRGACITADGGYAAIGRTVSTNGDVSGNHGGNDVWIVKLTGAMGIEDKNEFEQIELHPNPLIDNRIVNLQTFNSYCEIKINRINGGLVSEFKLAPNQKTLDLSVLDVGVYLMDFNFEGKRQTVKLVVL